MALPRLPGASRRLWRRYLIYNPLFVFGLPPNCSVCETAGVGFKAKFAALNKSDGQNRSCDAGGFTLADIIADLLRREPTSGSTNKWRRATRSAAGDCTSCPVIRTSGIPLFGGARRRLG